MDAFLAQVLKYLSIQQTLQKANMILMDEKVRGYSAKKLKIEEEKRLQFQAYYHHRKQITKILNYEKFLNILMVNLKAGNERGAKNVDFNVENISKLLLIEEYEELDARIEELSEKYSFKRIEENMKNIEKNTLEMENAIVKLRTSNKRKKQQVIVNLSEKEQDIDDEITNSIAQLDLISDRVRDKQSRIHFMELKKDQLLKDIKEKEAVLAKRKAAEQAYIKLLEPDQFHSQPPKENTDDTQASRATTQ